MDEQKPRRRRMEITRIETPIADEQDGISKPQMSQQAKPQAVLQQRTSKPRKRDKRVPWLIALAIIEGLLIAVILCAVALYAMNGWSAGGVSGIISGLVSTPTPIPTETPTAVPTPTPTPVIEYVYVTAEPTATPIPTVIPTPVVEYVYITPEPTEVPTPTPIPTAVPVPTEIPRFDISLFENQEFCYVTVDDIESRAVVNVEYYGKVGAGIRPADSGNYLISNVSMTPSIYIHGLGKPTELPVFRIQIKYHDEDWLFIDRAIFKIGDITYTFEGIQNSDARQVRNGDVEEPLVILIGADNMRFIEAICNNTENIRMRLKGSKGYLDYVIYPDDQFVLDVRRMHETFSAAGGLSPVFLSQIPENKMIVE